MCANIWYNYNNGSQTHFWNFCDIVAHGAKSKIYGGFSVAYSGKSWTHVTFIDKSLFS